MLSLDSHALGEEGVARLRPPSAGLLPDEKFQYVAELS